MFKVNNEDTKTTPLTNIEQISYINFEQVSTGWV